MTHSDGPPAELSPTQPCQQPHTAPGHHRWQLKLGTPEAGAGLPLAVMTLRRHGVACPQRSSQAPVVQRVRIQHQCTGRQRRCVASVTSDSLEPYANEGTSTGYEQPLIRPHGGQAVRQIMAAAKPLGLALLMVAGVRLMRKVRRLLHDTPPQRVLHQGRFKLGIVWLRNDLRLHDHEALAMAAHECETVLPLYCFDPRDYASQQGVGAGALPRCSVQRAAFILGSLRDLRQRLQHRGGELAVRVGPPEVLIPRMARRMGAGRVYCHGEVTREDVQTEQRLSTALQRVGAALHCLWGGCTLYHKDDLANIVCQGPSDYLAFRRQVDQMHVRAPMPAPETVAPWPSDTRVDPGELPSLAQLGFTHPQDRTQTPGGMPEVGGETQALQQLHRFISHLRPTRCQSISHAHPPASAPTGQQRELCGGWCNQQQEEPLQAQGDACTLPLEGALGQQQQYQTPAETGALEGPAVAAFTRNISPWLSLGCLSPRQVYHELSLRVSAPGPLEEQQGALAAAPQEALVTAPHGPSRQHWLVYELMWRDFFRLILHKNSHGEAQEAPSANSHTVFHGERGSSSSRARQQLAMA